MVGSLQGAAHTGGSSLSCWEKYYQKAIDLDFSFVFSLSLLVYIMGMCELPSYSILDYAVPRTVPDTQEEPQQ